MLCDAIRKVTSIAFVNGDVTAEREQVIAETIDRLVIALALLVVVDEPMRSAVGEFSIRVAVLPGLEPDDRASITDVLPLREQVSWSFLQKRGKLDIAGLVNILEATTLGVTSHSSVEHGPLPGSETLARLTPRQREVMVLASAGYDARAIAERLHLAHVSVRRELSRAYKVLVPDAEPGMDLRTGAVLEYMRITSTSGSPQRLS